MPTNAESSTGPAIPDDALLLLNRATLVTHAVRTAVHEHAILQSVDDLARRDRPTAEAADVAGVADLALQLRRYEHRRSAIGATLHRPAGPMRARIDFGSL